MMEERSTVYCTNCRGEFIAVLDLALNGNHEITCPLCQHVHYRVVSDGVVTEDRWLSSAGPIYVVTTSTTPVNLTFNSTTTLTASAWLNRSDLTV